MVKPFYEGYVRTVETSIEGLSVADGDYIYTLDPHAARNNVVEYFFFVDGTGDQVDATGGTITVTMSPGEDVYQTITEGVFDATEAITESRTKPNGYGRATLVKITLDSITGPVTGFKAMITQNVS